MDNLRSQFGEADQVGGEREAGEGEVAQIHQWLSGRYPLSPPFPVIPSADQSEQNTCPSNGLNVGSNSPLSVTGRLMRSNRKLTPATVAKYERCVLGERESRRNPGHPHPLSVPGTVGRRHAGARRTAHGETWFGYSFVVSNDLHPLPYIS